MNDLAHLHMHVRTIDRNLRHVLLERAIGAVRRKLGHGLAAAGHGHALIEHLDGHVAAMHALEEFDVHDKTPLRFTTATPAAPLLPV